VAEILNDLKKAHPMIEKAIQKIDVKIWGHAMICPKVGFIHGKERKKAQLPINNNIHFAHSDLSGISIFEEAFYQGHKVAEDILRILK
jgi:hypothetical protein